MLRRPFRCLTSAIGVLAMAATLAVPADAATLRFLQHSGSPVTVETEGFSAGPSIELGNCLGTASDVNKCASVGEGFYGHWSTTTPRTGPADSYYAFLVAPGSGAVSAVVYLYWGIDGDAFMQSYFQADPADYPTVPAGYLSVVETGGLQDITDLFSNGGGVAVPVPEGLRIFVQTDAEAVPEPASMLLLASGLVGAGLVRRRVRSVRC